MAPEKGRLYDTATPIPTYDEAVASASRPASHPVDEHEHEHEHDHDHDHAAEGQSLLRPAAVPGASARRPGGYRPPTVETDDETDSLCGSTDSEDEAAHVRREMQEMDIVDLADMEASRSRNLSSTWGKRIGLALSLSRWRWRWRLPRMRVRLGAREGRGGGGGGGDGVAAAEEGTAARRSRWCAAVPALATRATLLIAGRVLAVVLVLGFLYLLFLSDIFSSLARRMGSQMFDPESIRLHVQSMVDPGRIRDTMEHFTSYAHLAGTEGDYALANGVKSHFVEFGLEDVSIDEYFVYLNYPKAGGRAVEILDKDGKPTWSAGLEEPDVGGERAGNGTFVFHTHSKAGDVKGPLVYANHGRMEDFKKLSDGGLDTRGAIALVRLGDLHADVGAKVRAAELAGFSGCIIYSDPVDDGFVRGQTAPDGRWLPARGVRRGSASLASLVLGDPLTPGWESVKNLPRLEPGRSPGLVNIPSLPVSWEDAQVLLQNIKGHGQSVPEEWVGGVPDVGEWWTGDASSPTVRLRNEQDEVEKMPVWNVYGSIVGLEQSGNSIIIGNHRDSLAFGASGPHSGTAVMLEVARVFGDLVNRGWRPLRTIEFMSWDAGEYNMMGSTEYVEKNLERLRDNAFAYINLDTAVTGDDFRAAGSPVFRNLLTQVLNRVSAPGQNTTVRELFEARHGDLEAPAATSDYAAFQDIAGTSSLDISFHGDGYPHGSSYDTFDWMSRVGDPGFVHHTLLGQVLGLMVVELADRPIMPFDMTTYSNRIGDYIDELQRWAKAESADGSGLDLDLLREAHRQVAIAVTEFNKWQAEWQNTVISANGWEAAPVGSYRCVYNSHMAKFETNLLDLEQAGGIPNRTQYRHVLFGPDLWSADIPAVFPAIRDAVSSGNWDLAKEQVGKAARIITAAAAGLRDGD